MLLAQPTFAMFCPTLIPTCTLHGAKTTDIVLTQSPRRDHKSTIIPINLLYLRTRVKKTCKSILPCLEAHLGDLSPFQPYGHFQAGEAEVAQLLWQDRTSRTHGLLCNLAGTVKRFSESTDVKQQVCNSHSSLMITQPWKATVVVGELNISVLQPSR